MAPLYLPTNTVYAEYDPTSLIAGDYPLMSQGVALASGLNSSGSPLAPGTVLGEVSNPGVFSGAVAAKGGNTGNGTLALASGATWQLANLQTGVYRVVFSSATAFQVYDPRNDEIGTGVNGTAFAEQIKFTVTAGGTAFVSGDEIDVTVTQAAAGIYSAASTAGGSNTGNGTLALASPAYLSGAQVGAYTVSFTAPTAFQVTDPSGNPVATGVTGTAFATQIGFTITAGGTAFVAGDTFTVTLSALNLFKISVATATDGSQAPIAVLAEWTDTSAGSVSAQAWTTGEFVWEQMTVDASWTMDTLKQALLASGRNIFVRSVGTAA